MVVVNTLCNWLLQLRRDQRARTTIEFSEVKPLQRWQSTTPLADDEHLIELTADLLHKTPLTAPDKAKEWWTSFSQRRLGKSASSAAAATATSLTKVNNDEIIQRAIREWSLYFHGWFFLWHSSFIRRKKEWKNSSVWSREKESKLWSGLERKIRRRSEEKWSENVCNFMLNDFFFRVATFRANRLGFSVVVHFVSVCVFSQLNGFKFEFYLLMREEQKKVMWAEFCSGQWLCGDFPF